MFVQYLDIITMVLGLIYIWLEYRASIWLWFVGIIMPLLDIWLYFSHGLYGDAGLAVYYTFAAIYGFLVWKFGNKNDQTVELPISHLPKKKYLLVAGAILIVWGVTYYILATYTNSTVPLLDAFTNALSIVALWALAKKYVEQWLFWIVVDAISFYLYFIKGIPFKAILYSLYIGIAIMGYRKWNRSTT